MFKFFRILDGLPCFESFGVFYIARLRRWHMNSPYQYLLFAAVHVHVLQRLNSTVYFELIINFHFPCITEELIHFMFSFQSFKSPIAHLVSIFYLSTVLYHSYSILNKVLVYICHIRVPFSQSGKDHSSLVQVHYYYHSSLKALLSGFSRFLENSGSIFPRLHSTHSDSISFPSEIQS